MRRAAVRKIRFESICCQAWQARITSDIRPQRGPDCLQHHFAQKVFIMASVIAAQLYTLRDYTKTAVALGTTLQKCKQIGYEAVQVSGIGAAITYKEVARLLNDTGLTCCATHINLDKAMENPQQVIDDHQAIGCQYTAVGVAPERYRSATGWSQLAKDMTELGRTLKAAGIVLGYHHHAMELTRYGDKTGMDILFGESDPSLVTAEIDTYWIQAGGGDPAAWIKKLSGRLPLLHLKDMSFGPDNTSDSLQKKDGESDEVFAYRKQEYQVPKPLMAEVGEGNLNWTTILKAASDAGVLWYIIEQDVCQRDPFDSLAISLRNVHAMGLH